MARYIDVNLRLKDDGSLKDLFVKPKRSKVVSMLRRMWNPSPSTKVEVKVMDISLGKDRENVEGKIIDFELLQD